LQGSGIYIQGIGTMKISEAAAAAVELDPSRVWSVSKNQHVVAEKGKVVMHPMYCKITVHPGIKAEESVEAYRAPKFEECLELIFRAFQSKVKPTP
jgi:hypothetical protein